MCSRAAFFSKGVILDEGSVEQMARRYEWDFLAPHTI
jgi:ABC-type polysaccharide/polyol phosphate transport system ATPase subunit